MELNSLVGNVLVKKDGAEVKTTDLSTKTGAVIGLYFSAHWCPPCRGFTPKLAAVYEDIKKAHQDFEIVFISSDNSEDEFKSYLDEMPWLALPFDNKEENTRCSEKFEIEGLPTLVILDAENGNVISTDGRSIIEDYGADAFPFDETRLQACKEEKNIKKEKALAELGSLSIIGPLTTIDNEADDLDVQSISNRCEALAIAFLFKDNDHGSSVVISKLTEVQKSLGKDKLGLIVVPLQNLKDIEEETKSELAGIPVIKSIENASEVVQRFEAITPNIEAPHVIVLTPDGTGSFTLCAEDAARDIYFTGADGFPWSSEALKALEEKNAALQEELKSRQKNLEFLTKENKSLVVDKNGDTVSLNILQSNDVIGLYFSAHWCGPCRGFTPKLARMYTECKMQNKKLAVVFVSSDNNEDEFKEYYGEMPWYALSYNERELKSALSDLFEVEGIPTLVLLTGQGDMITDDGCEVVSYGANYFPWDGTSIAKAREDEAKMREKKIKDAREAEEKSILAQEQAGKIVLRRHIGSPTNVSIDSDHTVKFNEFSTVVASSAVIPEGKKVFYEVVFQGYEEISNPISQIGWAMDGFESSDKYIGDGVGDCEYSYGYDGQRQCKWHKESSGWGKQFDPNEGVVLGIAADLEKGELLYGLNGDWKEPMGLAFDGIEKNIKLFPALTGSEVKLAVNFGDTEFKYGPPDSSFVGLTDALKSQA